MYGSDWSAGILACHAAVFAASKDGGQVCVGNLECKQHPNGTEALDHDVRTKTATIRYVWRLTPRMPRRGRQGCPRSSQSANESFDRNIIEKHLYKDSF